MSTIAMLKGIAAIKMLPPAKGLTSHAAIKNERVTEAISQEASNRSTVRKDPLLRSASSLLGFWITVLN